MARKHVTMAEFKAALEAGQKPEDMIVTKGVMTKADGGDQMLRVRTFEVTNEGVDRDGDIIKQAGLDWTNYQKNPVMLWAHDAKALPIAKGIGMRKVGTKTLWDYEFAPADANPVAEQVLKLIDGDFLKTVSIGFIPKAVTRVDTKDRKGWDIDAAEALEVSVVPVPSNPDALRRAAADGVDVSICKDFIADALKAYRLNDAGEVEAVPAPKTAKDLYDVGSTAYLLNSLVNMQRYSDNEREWEGDDSQVPEMLAAVARQLGDALIAMTQEEISEALAGMDADGSKALRRLITKSGVKATTKDAGPTVNIHIAGNVAADEVANMIRKSTERALRAAEANGASEKSILAKVADLLKGFMPKPAEPPAPVLASEDDIAATKALATAAIARAKALATA